MTSVPNVPEGGNTISPSSTLTKCNPAKKWCFTLNNHRLVDIKYLETQHCAIVPKMMFQTERGENEGTPHLQGWLEFSVKKRPMSVYKNMPRIHWEKMKGTLSQNIEYCSKTDTYTGEHRS